MIIKILLLRKNELIQKNIELNKDNFFIIKTLLRIEKNKINNKFKQLRKEGIIKSIKKNPRTTKIKYRDTIKKMILSRKTTINALNNFRKI